MPEKFVRSHGLDENWGFIEHLKAVLWAQTAENQIAVLFLHCKEHLRYAQVADMWRKLVTKLCKSAVVLCIIATVNIRDCIL